MSILNQTGGLVERVVVDASAPDAVVSSSSIVSISTRRGRKPGVRTVSATVNELRAQWLRDITTGPGIKTRLSSLLGAPDSFVSHLIAGRRTFTDRTAASIEKVLGLEVGTIDAEARAAYEDVSNTATGTDNDTACALDPGLEKVLVAIFQKALSDKRMSDEQAIKILICITES
jgi:hypothetical protein